MRNNSMQENKLEACTSMRLYQEVGCNPSLREVVSTPFSRCRDYLRPSFSAANPAASRSAPEGATLAARLVPCLPTRTGDHALVPVSDVWLFILPTFGLSLLRLDANFAALNAPGWNPTCSQL
jgi:hypothetical protein